MSLSQMNKQSNQSIIAALSLISLLGLTVCSCSSESNTNTRDGGVFGAGGSTRVVVVPSTGGSGGTSTTPLSSTVTNGTTFFDSKPACLCPPSSLSCAVRSFAVVYVPLNAVNKGVPGYQYCFLTDPSTYTCWNCADAG